VNDPKPVRTSPRLGALLRGEQDRALGRRAVRDGLLSEAELETLLAEGASVEERLRALGTDPSRLRGEMDREDFALFRPDRRLPDEARSVQGDPERRIGELILVSRIGHGGVGEVWKAWDAKLGRWVAVKLPTPGPDPEDASRRFTREALAAARLSHPNIVSIHHVGEERGRPYIVMQFVDGMTLARTRPALRDSLAILRTVAQAVHHAHGQGVVHRDLKPANIMVASDGRPFVLDFGLAFLQDAARLQSREGTVAGTAAYMSPEQARGEASAKAPATDVYALGATLYDLATGRPPFDGQGFADTIEKVIHEEPVPPRALNPALPRDVETVILKALAKEPARRYATARDFADDLDRCLDEQPVAATRTTAAAALFRRVRRHPRIALVVSAAIGIALAAAVGLGLQAQRAAQIQRDQEVRLRTLRNLAKLVLETSLELRRAGLNDRMYGSLPQLEASYEEASASLPRRAEIDSLMGRVHRALLNDERALELQERALAKEPDFLPALYERIVLSSRAFGRSLLAARSRAAALPPGPVTAEAARRAMPASLEAVEARPELARAREGIVRDCETLERLLARGWEGEGSLRLGEAHALAARGLFAYHRGDPSAARGLLERAISADPSLEEAWEALARTWLAAGGEESADHAERVFTVGIERDRGYVPHWIGRADVRAGRAHAKSEGGEDPAVDHESAEEDYTQAIRLRPSAEGHLRRATLRLRRALHRARLGGDPRPDLERAALDGDAARRLAPDDPAIRIQEGALRVARAEAAGACARADAEAYDREAEPLLARDPCLAAIWTHRATLWGRVGDFDRSENFFNEALRYDPAAPEAWERRAAMRVARAVALVEAGGDAKAWLDGAGADLQRARELDPALNRARLTAGRLHRTRAQGRAEPEAAAALAAAREELAALLRRNPTDTLAWVEQAHVELDAGRLRQRAGDAGGSRPHFIAAVRHFEEALRLNPSLSEPLRAPLREARRALLGGP
jgi:serine/threonine-protein kinase